MDKNGIIIGILLGLGTGLLLGSEFSGSIVTIAGAILVVISLISMAALTMKNK